MSKIRITSAFKRRLSWQIGLAPTDDPYVVAAVVKDSPSPFAALRLYVFPGDFVVVEIAKNGQSIKDHLNRTVDEDFFCRWKTPPALMPRDYDGSLLELQQNAVYVTVENGDRLQLRAKWGGAGSAPKLTATFVGFVEK